MHPQVAAGEGDGVNGQTRGTCPCFLGLSEDANSPSMPWDGQSRVGYTVQTPHEPKGLILLVLEKLCSGVRWERALGSAFQILWTAVTTPFTEGHPDVPMVRNAPSSSAICTMVLVEL